MIKYHPYKSDKPNKNIILLQITIKKVYFGQAGASDFTFHKDEARKQRYINRHKNESKFWYYQDTVSYWALKYLWSYPRFQQKKKLTNI